MKAWAIYCTREEYLGDRLPLQGSSRQRVDVHISCAISFIFFYFFLEGVVDTYRHVLKTYGQDVSLLLSITANK